MFKKWQTIYRNPKKIIPLPTINDKMQVFPFKHDYDTWADYYTMYSSAAFDSFHNAKTKAERAEAEMHSEALCDYYNSLYEDAGMEPIELSPEDKAEIDAATEEYSKNHANKDNTPKNPCWRPANFNILYEHAIFNIFMAKNEHESKYKIEENELYYAVEASSTYANQDMIVPTYIMMLAANIIYNELQGQDHIVLTHWGMLPALMLLLPCLEAGTKVTLPPLDDRFLGSDAYELLFDFLSSEIARIEWIRTKNDATIFMPDSLVLGFDPEHFFMQYHLHIQEFAHVRTGFIYTNWNFLSLGSLEYKRRTLLETNAIRAVLQLSRPRRSGAKNYPAALILGKQHAVDTEKSIRMVLMLRTNKRLKEKFNYSKSLKLINGAEQNLSEAFDVQFNDIMGTEDTRLNPSYYSIVHGRLNTNKTRLLKDYAEVLRCQVKREPEQQGGLTLVREVSLSELDGSSNFLDVNAGKRVSIKLTKLQEKYLLQVNDIIFAYRGSLVTIGKSGFVTNADDKCIPGQAIYIIRPKKEIYAVWLYYQLNSKTVQDWIKAHVTGKNLALNQDKVFKIPLPAYKQKQADDINVLHVQMLSSFATLTQKKDDLKSKRHKIYALLDG